MQKLQILGISLIIASSGFPAVRAIANPPEKLASPAPLMETLSAPTFSAEELDTLASGEILISVSKSTLGGHKAAYIQSSILIDATSQEIWAIFTDCARAPTYVKGLVSCTILEQAKDKSWDIRRHINKPAALLPKMKSEFRASYTYPSKVTFHGVGGDFTGNVGRWDLTTWPRATDKDAQRTIISYNAKIASKTMFPDKMIRNTLKKNIPNVLGSLRKEVMKDKAKNAAKTRVK